MKNMRRQDLTNNSSSDKRSILSHELDDELKKRAFYDTYDYAFFWRGRDYEKKADALAISRLLSRIDAPHRKIADIGAGMGRMIPLYEKHWNNFVLIDPSKKQLALAMKNVAYPKKAKAMVGIIEHLPLPDASCDAALCVRVFHYVVNPDKAIKEVARIIRPGGYLILEIPNKIHFKERIGAILKGKHHKLMTPDSTNHTKSAETVFLRHHPEQIAHFLEKNGFTIIKKLSVSNFRSPLIKKIVPTNMLISFEGLSQQLLAPWWFGPSIYFFARKDRKNKNN